MLVSGAPAATRKQTPWPISYSHANARVAGDALSGDDLLRVAARVAPTNIAAHPARLFETAGLCVVVANPSPDGVRVRDGAVCLGGVFGEPGEWWRAGSDAPDGTYALLRYNEAVVELLSDVVASRTIWYVVADEVFLASTSQRALVALLGGLQLSDVGGLLDDVLGHPRTRGVLGRPPEQAPRVLPS